MNGYFIRKILKNALICFFACWLIYFIREQANGYIALAALHLTVNGAEEMYADGEPVTGKNAEVRRWFFTFRNIRTGYTDPLGIYLYPHKIEWETAAGRVFIGWVNDLACFKYSIKVGGRYFSFEGVADCENFVFCSGCNVCSNWEKW